MLFLFTWSVFHLGRRKGKLRCISPESVKIIKLSCFLFKDVQDHVVVVDQDPKARLASLDPKRMSVFFQQGLMNRIDDGPNLRLRFRRTDDKKIGERGQVADLVNDNFLSVLRLGRRRNGKGFCFGVPGGCLRAGFL